MATITLRGLTKHYDDGDIVAVDGVDIDVREGEFLVLVGPSGSGKSSILRLIAGLEEVTDGEVMINGEVVNDQKPRNRDIAMVFQNYALYPNMTVRDNLEFGLKMSTSMSKADRRETIEQTAAKVDIPDLLDKHPPQLSGGEKQRVALGRAIVRDPSVFLMDEPLSNLDAKLRRTMRTELEALQDDLGVTTVYVTHNQTEAMTMGDRIVVLKDARVQQVGTPLECYLEPQNQFVAGFIGDPPMNMLEGAVDGSTFQSDAGEYRLPPEIETALDGHDHVTLGIRPEDIELTTDPQDAQHVKCTVRMIEEMGAIQHIYVETEPAGTELIILADGKEPITEGETYAAVLPQENVHFFDTESGTALHNCMLRDEREAKLELSRRDVTMS